MIYCKKFYLDEARRETTKNFSSIVSWAHQKVSDPKDLMPPSFASKENQSKLSSNLSIWYNFNKYIMENGPQLPLKVIRHGSQVYYSKIKTGVNGTSKQAAIISSPTTKLPFEKKYYSNTLSKLMHASHVSWKISELETMLKQNFTLKGFKNKFSHLQSIGDFTFRGCQQLLLAADNLSQGNETHNTDNTYKEDPISP